MGSYSAKFVWGMCTSSCVIIFFGMFKGGLHCPRKGLKTVACAGQKGMQAFCDSCTLVSVPANFMQLKSADTCPENL